MMQNKAFQGTVIVSDMDGTFLGKNSALVPRNLKAIEYFCKNGGVFTLATGRCIQALKVLFPNPEDFVNGPAILCGGAYLYDFKAKKAFDPIPLNAIKLLPILENIQAQIPDAGYRISFEGGFLCPNLTPFLEEKLVSMKKLICLDELRSHLNENWYKAVFCAHKDTIASIRRILSQIDLSDFSVTTSSPNLLEILDVNASKGKKIGKIKDFYGPDSCIICVGDYDNDLDMLAACDLPACPENACEDVKKIASIQLCNHQEGCIADLIYKLDDQNQKITKFSEEHYGQ